MPLYTMSTRLLIISIFLYSQGGRVDLHTCYEKKIMINLHYGKRDVCIPWML